MVACSCVFLRCLAVAAEPTTDTAPLPLLSPIFGDNMVLQRGKPNTVWGWTTPGETVNVAIAGHTASARAGDDGTWRVSMDVPPVGGPYDVAVTAAQSVTLHNVLVGDVWLCSGQSNMYWPLRDTPNGAETARAASHEDLRLFRVPNRVAYASLPAPSGRWEVCAPQSAAEFSAVAYSFARAVQRDLHVPIGLILAASGGSPAESWMSAASLERIGESGPQLAAIADLRRGGKRPLGSFLMHWLDEYDIGGRDNAWAQPEFDDTAWPSVTLPGRGAEIGMESTPGVWWFRREFTLLDEIPPGAARIFLGVIDKMDTTFVNGRWIGASSWVENPRAYTVPREVLRPGRNVVAVRVFKLRPNAGFQSAPDVLRLQLGDGSVSPLAGSWRSKISVDAQPPHPLPLDLENYATMPTVFANGSLAPIAPLAITGALWYQGEANFLRAKQYRKLLPALVRDWREQFQQGDLPFYIVSLPAFMERRATPGGYDGWTEIREAQAETVRALPNTGLAITIDMGDAENIHPPGKEIVGERLARCALAQHYGVDVPFQGPAVRAVERLSGALKILFDHTDGGLVVRGDKLAEFAIAGEDRVWRWAEARLEGDTIVVRSPEVPVPVAVRYAWQANPEATLFNGAGLPAAPFRTDDWALGE